MSPSVRYEPLFNRMEWSVRLLYQCADLEEELKERKKVLKVDEFLLEVCLWVLADMIWGDYWVLERCADCDAVCVI